jgi:hypothetical protein
MTIEEICRRVDVRKIVCEEYFDNAWIGDKICPNLYYNIRNTFRENNNDVDYMVRSLIYQNSGTKLIVL